VYASAEGNIEKLFGGSVVFPQVCPFASGGLCYGGRLPSESGIADKVGFGLETLAVEAGLVDTAGTWAVTAE
jgi:hypothetical protein